MASHFGAYIRKKREALSGKEGKLSVRKLAGILGVQPSYLSKIERGHESLPTEERIRALAKELNEDPDVLLALAGKVSHELQAIIIKRPTLFSELIREIKGMPDQAILRLVREIRDGNW